MILALMSMTLTAAFYLEKAYVNIQTRISLVHEMHDLSVSRGQCPLTPITISFRFIVADTRNTGYGGPLSFPSGSTA